MNHSLDIVELNELRQNAGVVQLVDMRSASEYGTGHLPEAMNIPLEQVEGRLDDLRSDVSLFDP